MRVFFPFKADKLKNYHQHCTASLQQEFTPSNLTWKPGIFILAILPHTSVVQEAMSKPALHLENKWLKGVIKKRKRLPKRGIIYACSKSDRTTQRVNGFLLQSNLIQTIHSELNFWTLRIFRKSRTLNKIRHFTMKIKYTQGVHILTM